MSLFVSHDTEKGEERLQNREEGQPSRKESIHHGMIAACGAVLLILVLSVSGIFGLMADSDEEQIIKDESMAMVEEVNPGDNIYLGSYLNEPIEWRVLKVSEDGKSAVVVAKDILTMKAFDAAEGGRYNYLEDKDYWGEDIREETYETQRLLRGDNRWRTSNIRIWLNSTKEHVTYAGQEPTITAMSEAKNGYDTEAGFLNGFTEAELNAIVVTTVETDGEITEDKVFLLSSEELEWFKEADVSLAAVPTKAAVKQDASRWYEMHLSDYHIKDHSWWLRDAGGDAEEAGAYQAYMISNSYTENVLIMESVGLEGFGIRPAMTVDLTAKTLSVAE